LFLRTIAKGKGLATGMKSRQPWLTAHIATTQCRPSTQKRPRRKCVSREGLNFSVQSGALVHRSKGNVPPHAPTSHCPSRSEGAIAANEQVPAAVDDFWPVSSGLAPTQSWWGRDEQAFDHAARYPISVSILPSSTYLQENDGDYGKIRAGGRAPRQR